LIDIIKLLKEHNSVDFFAILQDKAMILKDTKTLFYH